MTALLFERRFLADYARNPVNLLLLALVPVVFVGVVAGSLADFANLLGGPSGSVVETATAGWAAAFLAGIAMYFLTATTRDIDRRLIFPGLPTSRLVLARLLTASAVPRAPAGLRSPHSDCAPASITPAGSSPAR